MAYSKQEYDAIILKLRARMKGSIKEANSLIQKMEKEKPLGYKSLIKEVRLQVGYAKVVVPKKDW